MALRPSTLRAAVSPSAVALVVAGAGIGLLVFHAWVLAVILGFAGWSGRMAAAALSARRKEEAARPRPASVDPWSVPDPWRALLRQAADAQDRFDRIVADWPPGPLRDRLLGFQPEVWADVGGLAAMARRGAALTGWTGAAPAAGRPSPQSLSAELKRIASERALLGPEPAGRAEHLDRQEEAVASQLRALRRSEQAAAELLDRLRVAVAALDRSVTELLSIGDGVGESVESSLQRLGDEVTALRAAVAETAGPPPEPPTP